jgi:hypothetical protein
MRSRLRCVEICELEEREMKKYAMAGLYSHWKSLFHSVLHELMEGTALACKKKMWMRVIARVGLIGRSPYKISNNS